jgi:acyl dehydratase
MAMSTLHRWTGKWLVIAAGWLTLAAHPLAAQEAARVVGRVTDGVGNPLNGAALVLTADSGGARLASASGETGGFQFAGLPAGRYTLRAERPGFAPATVRVSVRAGERRTVFARLRPGRGEPEGERRDAAGKRP